MHECVCAYVHVFVYVYMCLYVCVYVCMCSMCAPVCVCTYVGLTSIECACSWFCLGAFYTNEVAVLVFYTY